jgi:hypothetical protein
MVGIDDFRERLGRWSPAIFLVAGGLLSVTAAIEALSAFTAVAVEEGPLLFVQSLAGFGGSVLSFVALVGLSVRLADGSPRLAKLGVGLVTLPALFVLSLLLCVTVVSVLDLLSPTKVLPALEVVTGTVFLMAVAGVTALGVAGLRTDALSRTVGGALFALAAAWFLLFAAMLGYGHVSDLTNLVATGLMAAATVVLGVTLRDETDPVVTTEPTLDSTV